MVVGPSSGSPSRSARIRRATKGLDRLADLGEDRADLTAQQDEGDDRADGHTGTARRRSRGRP